MHCASEDNETRLGSCSVLCAFPRSAHGFALHNLTSFSHPFCNQRSCGCRTNTWINVMICVVHLPPLLPHSLPSTPKASMAASPPPPSAALQLCDMGAHSPLNLLSLAYVISPSSLTLILLLSLMPSSNEGEVQVLSFIVLSTDDHRLDHGHPHSNPNLICP